MARVVAPIALLACVVALVVGCTADPRAGTTSAPPDGAGVTPVADEGCFVVVQGSEDLANDLNSLRRDAATVVVGRFQGYGEPAWNTKDGTRPEPSDYVGSPASLVRPVRIEVTNELKGSPDAADLAVQRGGELGCDKFAYTDDPVLREGAEYVFFLVPLYTNQGEELRDQLILEAFLVNEAGLVETPRNGELSVGEVRKALVEGIEPSAPPSPGEPEPSTP